MSTFKIGGEVRYAAFPKTIVELCEIFSLAKKIGIKARVIGNASNILFSSHGIDGLIIFTLRIKGVTVNDTHITAECGAMLSHVCNAAREHSLSGAEFAFGIPGTVGGAVYMNAGAHGGEISQILTKSVCFDTESGQTIEMSNEEHGFSYRKSVFSEGKLLHLSSVFTLSHGDHADISEKMAEYTSKRKASQPLNMPNAGSIFKRPVNGFAGKYIEDSGLKGYSIGGAQVSEKHAGFIVNTGGASSDDVIALIETIKRQVMKKFDVCLENEIIYIE
jgi:UDP-N-acetylmuramate dehydrogenase